MQRSSLQRSSLEIRQILIYRYQFIECNGVGNDERKHDPEVPSESHCHVASCPALLAPRWVAVERGPFALDALHVLVVVDGVPVAVPLADLA